MKEELPVAKDGLPALQDVHPTALVSAIDLDIVFAMHFPTVGLSVMYVMTCILYLLLWNIAFTFHSYWTCARASSTVS